MRANHLVGTSLCVILSLNWFSQYFADEIYNYIPMSAVLLVAPPTRLTANNFQGQQKSGFYTKVSNPYLLPIATAERNVKANFNLVLVLLIIKFE